MTRPAADVVLGGRYRLGRPIAAGGMGTVWEARDQTLGRSVAVKVLNEGLSDDPRFLERFRREARAAAGFAHPNVAGVYDYGEEGGRPYIVMELVDGETVAQRLMRSGPFDPAEAARIAAGVADALQEAHEQGIVHRDVKPANVILSSRGAIKVTDFGIAASTDATNLTATGMIMGTARYLSPEQAQGGRATPASDLYALGVLLYEMLAGRPPFDGESPVATAMSHVNDAPAPLASIRRDIPPEIVRVAEACLAKDPAGRPASAGAVAAALRADPERVPDPVPAATATLPEPATTAAIAPDPTAVLPTASATPTRRARWLVPALILLLALAAILLVTRTGGPPDVRVPSFHGMTRAQAVAAARRAHLTTTFSTRPDPAPKGTVIGQVPAPGANAPQGSPVALVLSAGPPLVAVPALDASASEEEVRAVLTEAGLVFGGFVTVKGGPGIVGTDPAEGTPVPRGTSVVVLVGEHGRKHKGND